MLGAINAKVNKIISTEKEPMSGADAGKQRNHSVEYEKSCRPWIPMQNNGKLVMTSGWATECGEFSRDPHTPPKESPLCVPSRWGALSPHDKTEPTPPLVLDTAQCPHMDVSFQQEAWAVLRCTLDWSDLWLLPHLLKSGETKPVTFRMQQKGASEVFSWRHWGPMVGKSERRNPGDPSLRDVEPGPNLLTPLPLILEWIQKIVLNNNNNTSHTNSNRCCTKSHAFIISLYHYEMGGTVPVCQARKQIYIARPARRW